MAGENKKKTMNDIKLKKPYSISKAIKAAKLISLIAIILTLGSTSVNIYLLVNMSSSVWVRDGADYYQVTREKGISVEDSENIYKEHITRAIELGYELDEGTYDRNLDRLMVLMGESGKEIFESYSRAGVKNYLMQENAVSTVDSVEINLKMDSYPVQGRARFVQTFTKYNDKKSRVIEAEFIIYNVSSWKQNKLGAKIEDWSYKIYEI